MPDDIRISVLQDLNSESPRVSFSEVLILLHLYFKQCLQFWNLPCLFPCWQMQIRIQLSMAGEQLLLNITLNRFFFLFSF